MAFHSPLVFSTGDWPWIFQTGERRNCFDSPSTHGCTSEPLPLTDICIYIYILYIYPFNLIHLWTSIEHDKSYFHYVYIGIFTLYILFASSNIPDKSDEITFWFWCKYEVSIPETIQKKRGEQMPPGHWHSDLLLLCWAGDVMWPLDQRMWKYHGYIRGNIFCGIIGRIVYLK